jgi:exopolysaccharide production protein ExoZ
MRENYLSIQYLRAFAALLVVMHHTRNPHPWLFNPLENFGGFAKGVDVFFVISGFIMAAIGSREAPLDFAKKRLIRVAPMYWLATTLVFLQMTRTDGLTDELLARLIKSILFIPHLDPKGNPFPLLIPGWTLNYEMFFYGIFCLSLLSRKPIQYSLVALTSLTAIGLATNSNDPVFTTYTNTRLMEFSAGLVIGSTRKEIAGKTWMSAMLPAGLALLFTFDHWSVNALSSAMIVAGAISLEKFIPTIPTIKLLGDASYLIYISHHFTLSKLHKLWPQTQLTGELQFYGLMITRADSKVKCNTQGFNESGWSAGSC